MLKEINLGNIHPNKFGELVRHMKEISGMTIQELYKSSGPKWNGFFLPDWKIKYRHDAAELILAAARKGESSLSIKKRDSGWDSAEEMSEHLGLQVEEYEFTPYSYGSYMSDPSELRYKISW